MLPADVRVYVCLEPTDMRRSFDRLAGMVQEFVGREPADGSLFVFRNRAADKLKILFWFMPILKIIKELKNTFCKWQERNFI